MKINKDKVREICQEIVNTLFFMHIVIIAMIILFFSSVKSAAITRDDNPDKITILNGRIQILEPLKEKEDDLSIKFTFRKAKNES